MAERQKFEMTKADLDLLLDTINRARSTPLIMLNVGMPESPQEAANRAWSELGKRMGFDPMSVLPTGEGDRFFSAVPVAALSSLSPEKD